MRVEERHGLLHTKFLTLLGKMSLTDLGRKFRDLFGDSGTFLEIRGPVGIFGDTDTKKGTHSDKKGREWKNGDIFAYSGTVLDKRGQFRDTGWLFASLARPFSSG